LREFKRFDGDLAEFGPAAVGRFEFNAKPGDLIA
jgi:hypothetical protein